MRGSWVQTGKFDPEIFKEVDITKDTEFAIAAPLKKVQILSSHPAGSYELVAADEKNSTLKILDAAKFWSGEKFLVVKYKD